LALRLAATALAALTLVGVAAASGLKTKTAALGNVRATVSWQPLKYVRAKNVRLVISRDGQTVLSRKLSGDVPQAIAIRDLDGSGEPQVILDLYTGGAHCCFSSSIYRFTGAGYVPLDHAWGDLGYLLKDLNSDGIPEFVSADDSFAYAFTAYAGSAFPIQIWDYTGTGMTNVTRSYPALIQKDAQRLWKSYLKERSSKYSDPRGILAAWMADEYLLGKQAAGWATMKRLNAKGQFRGIAGGDYWAKNGAYLAKLRRFLVKFGYAGKR
jgi:hypothetical protein